LTTSTAELDVALFRASALLDSDPAGAASAASEILRVSPGHAAASLLLATAARTLGDPTAALGVLEGLVRGQPRSPVIHLELGRAYGAAARGAEALIAMRRAVALEPELADGWRDLSGQLAAHGDAHAADEAYARYAALIPEAAGLSEAAAALYENRPAAAENLLRRQLEHSPRDAAAMRLLADAVGRREGYAEAEFLLRKCLELAPGYSAARYDLARLLLAQQKPTLLPPLIDRLLLLDPQNAAYRDLQASFLSLIGRHAQALEVLASLVDEWPGSAGAWINYGHELKAAGRQQQSIDAYRKVIALAPTSGAAYWSLANLKTFRFEAADLAEMQNALQRVDLRPDDRVGFEFAVAKALEDDAQYCDSFAHYAAGNSRWRTAAPYNPDKFSAPIMSSKRLYTREFFAQRQGWGSQATDPIFIVGLPRSGSTLLEQILASHSRVEGTRELDDITALARQLGDTQGELDAGVYLKSIASLRAGDFSTLAERYLADTRIYRQTDRPRFVDKMPNNFLHIGLIHLMFPNASIIDARRHPIGCCFSCFKQHFADGQRFTYDQTDLGRFYRDYVDLMAHFDAVLPGRVHRVQYERVVQDLRQELLQLLDYCGLPFEKGCLRFFENPRGVQTASAEQVRQPIFSESVEHWRHFEPWLGPLKEALGDLA
jgi:tetratricopeptide (TPR) repeat protein